MPDTEKLVLLFLARLRELLLTNLPLGRLSGIQVKN